MIHTQTFTTKQDALDQEIIPSLGEFAADFDIDGIFADAFQYCPEHQGFHRIVPYVVDEDGHFDADAWNQLLQLLQPRINTFRHNYVYFIT